MADLNRLLGSMLATGMGGRSARGPVFAAGTRTPPAASHAAGGGGFRNAAGVASLGYLAYKAWQEMKARDPAATQSPGVHLQARSGHGDGPSLGDRMADLLARGPAPDDPAMKLADDKALLLVRAMVAAADADGRIDADERTRILGTIDEAGADADERRILEKELDDPPSIEDIAARAQDPETAEEVYLAARMAISVDSEAERTWLRTLADRLNLSDAQRDDLRRIA